MERYSKPWWEPLGLSLCATRPESSSRQRRKNMAHEEVLRAYRPSSFEKLVEDGTTDHVPVEQIVAEIEAAHSQIDAEIDSAKHEGIDRGWAAIRAAREAPDADVIIRSGSWEGFTRADAKAWLWNFIQYEPYQLGGVFKTLRRQRERDVEAGQIPNSPTYASRARGLVDIGTTPEAYRRAQEAIGREPFSEQDVEHGP